MKQKNNNKINTGIGRPQLRGTTTSNKFIRAGEETLERGYDSNLQIP